MATGQFFNPPLRHIGRATTSGTFVIPASVSKVFVTVTGARGGQPAGTAGATVSSGGFVEVLPGSTAQIVIGAGGGGGAPAGTQGGTTSFDGAITIIGSGGGSSNPRYGAQTGSAATASATTSLPTGSPAGAIARVSSTTTSGPNGDISAGGSGIINIYA